MTFVILTNAMIIFTCDVCKKRIKDRNEILHFERGLNRISLCGKCSKPVTLFLKKRGLIEREVFPKKFLVEKVGIYK